METTGYLDHLPLKANCAARAQVFRSFLTFPYEPLLLKLPEKQYQKKYRNQKRPVIYLLDLRQSRRRDLTNPLVLRRLPACHVLPQHEKLHSQEFHASPQHEKLQFQVFLPQYEKLQSQEFLPQYEKLQSQVFLPQYEKLQSQVFHLQHEKLHSQESHAPPQHERPPVLPSRPRHGIFLALPPVFRRVLVH